MLNIDLLYMTITLHFAWQIKYCFKDMKLKFKNSRNLIQNYYLQKHKFVQYWIQNDMSILLIRYMLIVTWNNNLKRRYCKIKIFNCYWKRGWNLKMIKTWSASLYEHTILLKSNNKVFRCNSPSRDNHILSGPSREATPQSQSQTTWDWQPWCLQTTLK